MVVMVVLALLRYPPGDNLWEIQEGFYPKDLIISMGTRVSSRGDTGLSENRERIIPNLWQVSSGKWGFQIVEFKATGTLFSEKSVRQFVTMK